MSREDQNTILLLGGSGQVGHVLQDTLAPLGHIVAPDSQVLPLEDEASIRKSIRSICPQLIVNAAAYTAVDRAEDEPERAMAVNGRAPEILAEEASRLGALLVHYSTDYVFDGAKRSPYREEDTPNPLNVYGRTKLRGDRAIQQVGGRYIILRTSWIYSAHRSSFLTTMIKLAERGEELRVVDDQVGCPTSATWLGRATAEILQTLRLSEEIQEHKLGLYHISCGARATWFEFAQAIMAESFEKEVELIPVTTEQYSAKARRPAYSVLSKKKVQQTFGLEIPTWEAGLKEVLRRSVDLQR